MRRDALLLVFLVGVVVGFVGVVVGFVVRGCLVSLGPQGIGHMTVVYPETGDLPQDAVFHLFGTTRPGWNDEFLRDVKDRKDRGIRCIGMQTRITSGAAPFFPCVVEIELDYGDTATRLRAQVRFRDEGLLDTSSAVNTPAGGS